MGVVHGLTMAVAWGRHTTAKEALTLYRNEETPDRPLSISIRLRAQYVRFAGEGG